MDSKIQKLLELNERSFREDVLIPLLQKMGYDFVRHRHGTEEYGKDITYRERDKLTQGFTYYAVVAKVGKISGSSSGEETQLVRTIQDQIEQAFEIPIEDVTDGNGEIYVNQVIVWTTGTISSGAQKRIKKQVNSQYKSNVRFIDGNKTIELLEEYYASFFTIGDAGISEYFEISKSHYSKLDELYTLGAPNTNLQLPTIFVPPTLEFAPKQKSKQAIREGRPNRTFSSLSKILETSDFGNIFIRGDMGSGKSTLLRRFVIEIIEKNENEMKKYPLPILIRFKNIDFDAPTSIITALQEQCDKFLGNKFSIDIKDLLDKGHLVILIDGLDELESDENIIKAIDEINTFSDKYPRNRLILASRTLEIMRTTNILDKFKVYKIKDFSLSQMEQLIKNWFGSDNPDSKQLIKLISDPKTYSTFPPTPLTLALFSILYQSGLKDLPASLTELFSRYVDLALGRWDSGKDLPSLIEWRKKERVISEISWDMITNDKFEILDKDVFQYIARLQDEGMFLPKDNIDTIHREILYRSGLFVKNPHGFLEFKHKTFMDYFSAIQLNKKRNSTSIVIEKFPSFNWSKVIFFACGLQPDAKGEEYLDEITKYEKIENCHPHYYALQLGQLAQATFSANLKIRTEAVRKSLRTFIDSWDEIAKEIKHGIESGEIKNPISHRLLFMFFSDTIIWSVGSSSLAKSLSLLVDEVLTPTIILTDTTQIKKHEWFVYGLAIACANSNNINEFLQILSSNLILEPVLIERINYEIEVLLEEDWRNLDKSQEKSLIEWNKKYNKKISDNGMYLNELGKKPPLLLNP